MQSQQLLHPTVAASAPVAVDPRFVKLGAAVDSADSVPLVAFRRLTARPL